MQITAIKTHKIQPKESLEKIIDQYIPDLPDGSVLAITSKIVSYCQGRLFPKDLASKYDLISQEADLIVDTKENPYGTYLTIKNGILLLSAGIDESNSNDTYILYPTNIQEIAATLWKHLRTTRNIKNLGIIITDSRTTPLRRGIIGVCLGWCGFEPFYSYIGKPDIYAKPLHVTQMNILDSLAVASVFIMGEGNEQTPLAIIKEAPKISFLDRPPTPDEEESLTIPLEEDIYAPIFQSVKWIRK